MGMLDDAKDTIQTVAKEAGDHIEHGIDRVKDKVDEVRADADVKKAEAERDSVKMRNEAKERMRD